MLAVVVQQEHTWSVSDVVTVIGVITTSIVGIITAIGTMRNRDQIRVVAKEVTTMNGQTLAMLADSAETRRVDLIHPQDRTQREDEHIESVTYQGMDPEGRDTTPEGVPNPPHVAPGE